MSLSVLTIMLTKPEMWFRSVCTWRVQRLCLLWKRQQCSGHHSFPLESPLQGPRATGPRGASTGKWGLWGWGGRPAAPPQAGAGTGPVTPATVQRGLRGQRQRDSHPQPGCRPRASSPQLPHHQGGSAAIYEQMQPKSGVQAWRLSKASWGKETREQVSSAYQLKKTKVHFSPRQA